jgi:lipid A 3-O-deacylase
MSSVRSDLPFFLPAVLAACLAAVAATATAADTTLLLEFGVNEGEEDVERYGAAVRWDLGLKWLETGDWHLGTHLEMSVTYWDGKPGTTGEDELVDFGLTPILRYQRTATSGLAPFAELGVGAHVHTEDGIGNRDFDIPFAFGTHFGAGARFGPQNQYELVYRFQHLSNAGLGDDNPGINFHAVQLGIHF